MDESAEQDLWQKKELKYEQKNSANQTIFRHMGATDDIDYCSTRLYINCKKEDLMKMAHLFLDKCNEQKIQTYFKYVCSGKARSDQMVIYSNFGDLKKYIQILQEIGKENPDIQKSCGKPPILTGTIDDWIGIGDNTKTGESYTELRSRIIQKVMRNYAKKNGLDEKTGLTDYSAEGVNFDKVRESLKYAFKNAGISIDSLAFNKDNMPVYMLDDAGIEQFDSNRKEQIAENKRKIQEDRKYLSGQIPIQELRILKQAGVMPEDIKTMICATSARYGFLLDVAKGRESIEPTIQNHLNSSNYIVSGNNTIKYRDESGDRNISDDEQNEVTSKLLEEVTQYYTKMFNEEKTIIDESLKRYAELDQMPRGENDNIDIERADLYSRLLILTKGKAFFEAIGIPSEQTELVCDRAQHFLDRMEEENYKKEKPQIDARIRQIDKEFLEIYFSESKTTDPEELRKLYENQTGLRVPEEDLEEVLKKFSQPKQITPSETGYAAANAGTGVQDINESTQILRGELEPEKEKPNELT